MARRQWWLVASLLVACAVDREGRAPSREGSRDAALDAPRDTGRGDAKTDAEPDSDGAIEPIDAEPDAPDPCMDGNCVCSDACDPGACTCAGSCMCTFACPPGECEGECSANSSCVLAAAATTSSVVWSCNGDAVCRVTTMLSRQVAVTCAERANCELACSTALDCDLTCSGESSCLLRCVSSLGECNIHCPTVRDCGGGVFACNRACP